MLLAEIKPRSCRIELEGEFQGASNLVFEQAVDPTFDFESWDLLSCWKQQQADRFGGGTPAPTIPRSQRQYDGDNFEDYCEPFTIR